MVIRDIRYFLEVLILKAFVSFLALLPLEKSVAVGKNIGLCLYAFLSSRNRIARKNLKNSFPQFSEEKVETLVKNSWLRLGEGVAEFVQMPSLNREQFFSRFQVDGLDSVRESQRAGRGVLFLTAHYGLWELGSRIMPELGFNMAVVARRVKNPYVDDLVTRFRSSSGTKVILARNAVRETIRWLKAGNVLTMLIDHRVMEGGLQVPFFGRPAYTSSLPAVLALRYSIPVHCARCWKDGEKIRLQFEKRMDFSDLDQSQEGVAEATIRMNRVVEEWIREHPELWLWIHNRWKT